MSATVVESRRQRVGVWKSSSLAVLRGGGCCCCGCGRGDCEIGCGCRNAGIDTTEEMERRAGGVVVRLRKRQTAGEKGWRFVVE